MKLDTISRLRHDIRSSLTCVKEGISLVRDGTLGKINRQQAKYLKIAEEGIASVVNLIDQLPNLKKKGRAKWKQGIRKRYS